GPAAGVIGAAAIAAAAGFPDLVTFDVGGTSTDVSLVEAGAPGFAAERTVAGYPVRVPMVDIQVIGAGGGSIAELDDAGALKVGPRSAGAEPGPAAYGRGGQAPTITDANLLLGRLNPAALLAGRLPLDVAAARAAVEARIAAPLGLPPEAAAEGILRIANAGMARAIRSISTERGRDLRRFALFAYGGAGPLHAGDVARELGIARVIVPQQPGTLCARGILEADPSFDLVRTRIMPATPQAWPAIAAAFAELGRAADAILDRERIPAADRDTRLAIDARYEGQNFEVPVGLGGIALDAPQTDAEFARRFAAAHAAVYGYDIPGRAVEIVNLRLKITGRSAKPFVAPLSMEDGASRIGNRAVYFGAALGWIDGATHDRARLRPGTTITGPAVIEEMSATTLLHPDQTATVDPAGNLIITVFPD
ncbi:MAG: hydantoinase/oxoprolinase family protein, partial [Alphaproteobacteria bacterium]|nr:hydantoinase/oxoprolinase family protein [Alphaproteobacteria bacterium]